MNTQLNVDEVVILADRRFGKIKKLVEEIDWDGEVDEEGVKCITRIKEETTELIGILRNITGEEE